MHDLTGPVVEVEMQALRYREAAWAAEADAALPPDTETLPDPVIEVLSRYEWGDLPCEAHRAVDAEAARRSPHDRVTDVLAWSALALSGSAGVTMWEVLAFM